MSPRFDQIRKLVWQSKRLQQMVSAKESEAWSKVLRHEEALSRRLKSSLQITPLDDNDGEEEEEEGEDRDSDGLEDVVRGAQDKRKRELRRSGSGGSPGGKCHRPSGGSGELAAVLPELAAVLVAEESRSPINELMKLYYSCLQGDGAGPENDDVAVIPPEVLSGVDEVAQDVLFDITRTLVTCCA